MRPALFLREKMCYTANVRICRTTAKVQCILEYM